MSKKEKEYSLDNIVSVGQSWPYTSSLSLFVPRILQKFLSDPLNQKLQNKSTTGTLTKTFEETVAKIESYGGKLVRQDQERDYGFLWDGSFLEFDYYKKTNTATMTAYYLDPKVGDLIAELEKDYLTKTKKNLIFSIVQTSTGLEARSMGDGSSPLITENYNDEVLKDVEFVLDAYKKNPPPGRITIFNGEPGTGKTHLIRSMLTQLDCVFLIVPSNLIDSMDKPNFLPLLMGVRDLHEKPIIMVIEDGDACLVPRKDGNMSAIASLLNLSDGIMGSIMDIRMIISTNADIKEVDSAISRPGRLCKQIHVGPLPYERANKVYKRLMKDESVNLDRDQKYYTLAQIYDRFNNKDSPAPVVLSTKKVIGFSTRHYDQNVVLNKKE